MIPKKIHYCWFGGKELPFLVKKCIESWKSYLPGYEIKLWNEANSPMHIGYVSNALKHRKWANISNYVRLHALFEDGGIYLDTDIEIIKPLDAFLNQKGFLCFESKIVEEDHCVNNAIIGAIPKHPFINALKEAILENFDGTEMANLSSPNITTTLLKQRGLKEYKLQEIDDLIIYPQEYFYPYSWNESFTMSCVKPETHAIHYYSTSWKEDALQEQLRACRNAQQYLHELVVGKVKPAFALKVLLRSIKNSLRN